MPRHRIVTLIASATEIVCALGCEVELVGRSHECDFPPSVERLPACSEPKIDVHGTSRQIDDRIKNVLKEALSVYRVHTDVLERLQPDVIITQDHCEVCAVSLKDVQSAACELLASRPAVVSLAPNALADVWQSIRQVAAALRVPERAETLIGGLQSRLDAIAAKVATEKQPGCSEQPGCCTATSDMAVEADSPQRPSIACIEWIDPLMAAGNWVPELVEIAGGIDLLGTPGKHSPWMNWDELLSADPNVIAVMPCGFDISRTRAEMPTLTGDPRWQRLKAVRSGRVYLTDGNQYFNRPGPRLVESAEILAEILHPELFDFGHRGSGWVPF